MRVTAGYNTRTLSKFACYSTRSPGCSSAPPAASVATLMLMGADRASSPTVPVVLERNKTFYGEWQTPVTSVFSCSGTATVLLYQHSIQ